MLIVDQSPPLPQMDLSGMSHMDLTLDIDLQLEKVYIQV